MTDVHPAPLRRSAWTTREKLVRVLWATAGRVLWLVPGWRSPALRLFGAEVGRGCRFARSVRVTIPWKLEVGDGVEVGERVILYSLGHIQIGERTVIDYAAHLCAGSHDLTDSRFPLTTPPIILGRDCFIGIDAFIGPNVALGDGCRVWPRASVYRNFPAGTELRGNPAAPVDSAVGADEREDGAT